MHRLEVNVIHIPVDNSVGKLLHYMVFNQRSQGLLETACKLGCC